QLALQHRGAIVINPQCAATVAVQYMEVHQLAVANLTQDILMEPLLGIADRPAKIARLLEQIDELIEGVEIQLVQPLADGDNPLIIAVRKEITSVTFRSLLQCCTNLALARGAPGRGDQGFEPIDVQLKCGCGPPVQRSSANLKILIERRKALPQMMECVAQ